MSGVWLPSFCHFLISGIWLQPSIKVRLIRGQKFNGSIILLEDAVSSYGVDRGLRIVRSGGGKSEDLTFALWWSHSGILSLWLLFAPGQTPGGQFLLITQCVKQCGWVGCHDWIFYDSYNEFVYLGRQAKVFRQGN